MSYRCAHDHHYYTVVVYGAIYLYEAHRGWREGGVQRADSCVVAQREGEVAELDAVLRLGGARRGADLAKMSNR